MDTVYLSRSHWLPILVRDDAGATGLASFGHHHRSTPVPAPPPHAHAHTLSYYYTRSLGYSHAPWLVDALHNICVHSAGFAFLPMVSTMLRALNCRTDDTSPVFSESCFQGGHVVLAIIVLITLPIFIPLCLFIRAVLIDRSPLSHRAGAQTHGRVDVVLCVLAIMLSLLFNTFGGSLEQNWFIFMVLAGTSIIWLVGYTRMAPFIQPRVNDTAVACGAAFAWMTFTLLLQLLYTSLQPDAMAFLGLPFAVSLGLAVSAAHRSHVAGRVAAEIDSIHDLDLWARVRLRAWAALTQQQRAAAASSNTTDEAQVVARLLNAGAGRRTDSGGRGNEEVNGGHLSLGSSSAAAQSVASRILLQLGAAHAKDDSIAAALAGEVHQAYGLLQTKSASSPVAHILAAEFYRLAFSHRYPETSALLAAQKAGASLDMSFFVYARSRQVREEMTSSSVGMLSASSLLTSYSLGTAQGKSGNRTGALDRALYDAAQRELATQEVAMYRAMLRACDALLEPTPDIGELARNAHETSTLLATVSAGYTALLAMNPRGFNMLRAFALFAARVLHDPALAASALHRADQAQAVSRASSNMLAEFRLMRPAPDLSFLDEAVASIVVAGDSARLGEVLHANGAACRMLGRPRSDVLGTSINSCIPAPFNIGHDGYIMSFGRYGPNRVVNAARQVLVQHAQGWVLPCSMTVAETVPLTNVAAPRLAAVMRPLALREHYVVCGNEADDFVVYAASAGTLALLGLDGDRLEERRLSAVTVFPALHPGFVNLDVVDFDQRTAQGGKPVGLHAAPRLPAAEGEESSEGGLFTNAAMRPTDSAHSLLFKSSWTRTTVVLPRFHGDMDSDSDTTRSSFSGVTDSDEESEGTAQSEEDETITVEAYVQTIKAGRAGVTHLLIWRGLADQQVPAVVHAAEAAVAALQSVGCAPTEEMLLAAKGELAAEDEPGAADSDEEMQQQAQKQAQEQAQEQAPPSVTPAPANGRPTVDTAPLHVRVPARSSPNVADNSNPLFHDPAGAAMPSSAAATRVASTASTLRRIVYSFTGLGRARLRGADASSVTMADVAYMASGTALHSRVAGLKPLRTTVTTMFSMIIVAGLVITLALSPLWQQLSNQIDVVFAASNALQNVGRLSAHLHALQLGYAVPAAHVPAAHATRMAAIGTLGDALDQLSEQLQLAVQLVSADIHSQLHGQRMIELVDSSGAKLYSSPQETAEWVLSHVQVIRFLTPDEVFSAAPAPTGSWHPSILVLARNERQIYQAFNVSVAAATADLVSFSGYVATLRLVVFLALFCLMFLTIAAAFLLLLRKLNADRRRALHVLLDVPLPAVRAWRERTAQLLAYATQRMHQESEKDHSFDSDRDVRDSHINESVALSDGRAAPDALSGLGSSVAPGRGQLPSASRAASRALSNGAHASAGLESADLAKLLLLDPAKESEEWGAHFVLQPKGDGTKWSENETKSGRHTRRRVSRDKERWFAWSMVHMQSPVGLVVLWLVILLVTENLARSELNQSVQRLSLAQGLATTAALLPYQLFGVITAGESRMAARAKDLPGGATAAGRAAYFKQEVGQTVSALEAWSATLLNGASSGVLRATASGALAAAEALDRSEDLSLSPLVDDSRPFHLFIEQGCPSLASGADTQYMYEDVSVSAAAAIAARYTNATGTLGMPALLPSDMLQCPTFHGKTVADGVQFGLHAMTGTARKVMAAMASQPVNASTQDHMNAIATLGNFMDTLRAFADPHLRRSLQGLAVYMWRSSTTTVSAAVQSGTASTSAFLLAYLVLMLPLYRFALQRLGADVASAQVFMCLMPDGLASHLPAAQSEIAAISNHHAVTMAGQSAGRSATDSAK